MKSLPLILLLVLTFPTGAVVLASDDFESYSIGELNGQNGGIGFNTPWSAVEQITEVVNPSIDLTYTATDGSFVSGGDRALRVTGNSDNAITRGFSTPISNDSFYVGFLIAMEAGEIGNNDFATLWFGEGSFIGAPAIGIKTESGPNNADLMGRISGGDEAYSPIQLEVGEAYYLVAQISKIGGSSTYNELNFWLNPTRDDLNNPILTSTGTIAFTEFNDIGIRSVNLDPDDAILYDALTFTDNPDELFLENVAPVPEPSLSILFSLGLLSIISKRNRT